VKDSPTGARFIQLGFLAVGLIAWYLAGRFSAVPPLFLPPIDAVWSSLNGLVRTEEFWSAIGVTLSTIAKAYSIAVVLGVLAGYLVTRSRFLTDVIEPLISGLFSIPIIGTANCGPATLFAEQNFQGFLRLSSKLIGRTKPTGLYAVKADGASMNRAEIKGRKIEDGDFIVIDNQDRSVISGDVVLAVIDDRATIKRFIDDRANGQIVLMADSSFDYAPIYLHPEDDFIISGKAIAVIKKPS